MGGASSINRSRVQQTTEPTPNETTGDERRGPSTPTIISGNGNESIASGTSPEERVSAPSTPARTTTHTSLSDERKLVLIIWDIEDVRLPTKTTGLSPEDIVRYMKMHYIMKKGLTEYRTCTAVSDVKYAATTFVKDLLPHLTVLVASNGDWDARAVLKREIQSFIKEHSQLARSRRGACTVVLVSGAKHFLEPVKEAIDAGFSVKLLHHDNANKDLLALSRRPVRWSHFLTQYSGVQDIRFS